MKYQKIYEELRKQYTEEEIVDSMLVPADLTETEAAELHTEMRQIRLKKLRSMTKTDKLLSDVMQLRFDMENYLKKEAFSFEKTFGKYLGAYLHITKKNRREIADDLSIHYTKLSRILNDKEEPNVELSYRLAQYSGNLIKAELWWQLMIKKQAFILRMDQETRQREASKVKNGLLFIQ